jgi:hypothetical protein
MPANTVLPQCKISVTAFGWEQFNLPPYSLDLAPSDFHVFMHLKTFLGGQWFNVDNEVKEAFNT